MNSFIQKNHFKTRRKLLALLASLPFSANLFGVSLDTPNAVKIEMNGDLDDDLIIVKANEASWNIEDCLQMHNPSDIFLLEFLPFLYDFSFYWRKLSYLLSLYK